MSERDCEQLNSDAIIPCHLGHQPVDVGCQSSVEDTPIFYMPPDEGCALRDDDGGDLALLGMEWMVEASEDVEDDKAAWGWIGQQDGIDEERAPAIIETTSKSVGDSTTNVNRKRERSASNESLTSSKLSMSMLVQRSKVVKKKARVDRGKSTSKKPTPVSAVDSVKYKRWQEKITATDDNAQFHASDARKARHSVCGTDILMKKLYDTARWTGHLQRCANKPKIKATANTPTLFTMAKTWGLQTHSSNLPLKKQRHRATEPCPGVTVKDSPHIPKYLLRTAALGGGAPSLTIIAKEKFRQPFASLGKKKQQQVSDIQLHRQQWRNDHIHQRVFSTKCKREITKYQDEPLFPCDTCKMLLSKKVFRNAIARPMPEEGNCIFTNHRYRNAALGKIYARAIGLKDIITLSVRCMSLPLPYSQPYNLECIRMRKIPLVSGSPKVYSLENTKTSQFSPALLKQWSRRLIV